MLFPIDAAKIDRDGELMLGHPRALYRAAHEKFWRGIVEKRRAVFSATLSLAFLSVWDRIRVVSQARE
jgi:hypothetical protein